jgi:hypothetical protein
MDWQLNTLSQMNDDKKWVRFRTATLMMFFLLLFARTTIH